MQAFAYAQGWRRHRALAAAQNADTAFLAGGTELLNWMRLGIANPALILDITHIASLDAIEALPDGGVRRGPTRNRAARPGSADPAGETSDRRGIVLRPSLAFHISSF